MEPSRLPLVSPLSKEVLLKLKDSYSLLCSLAVQVEEHKEHIEKKERQLTRLQSRAKASAHQGRHEFIVSQIAFLQDDLHDLRVALATKEEETVQEQKNADELLRQLNELYMAVGIPRLIVSASPAVRYTQHGIPVPCSFTVSWIINDGCDTTKTEPCVISNDSQPGNNLYRLYRGLASLGNINSLAIPHFLLEFGLIPYSEFWFYDQLFEVAKITK